MDTTFDTRRRHRVLRWAGAIAGALVFAASLPAVPVAVAEGARITGIEHVNDRWDKVSVFSPSMNKVIVNDVFKAGRGGAPTFYLL
ncbi:MAG: esterase family protein, partial [Mycolicibacterium neoaurum]|nr:esterase family protein [Mycolicibacterium neoaurum]